MKSDFSRTAADQRMDVIISVLLGIGVSLAALVTLAGGIAYLVKMGNDFPHYTIFHGTRGDLRSITGIVHAAFSLSRRGFIQLGILLLILTPIARVVFSAAAFLWQRDYFYVLVTLIVLGILLTNLIYGHL